MFIKIIAKQQSSDYYKSLPKEININTEKISSFGQTQMRDRKTGEDIIDSSTYFITLEDQDTYFVDQKYYDKIVAYLNRIQDILDLV